MNQKKQEQLAALEHHIRGHRQHQYDRDCASLQRAYTAEATDAQSRARAYRQEIHQSGIQVEQQIAELDAQLQQTYAELQGKMRAGIQYFNEIYAPYGVNLYGTSGGSRRKKHSTRRSKRGRR